MKEMLGRSIGTEDPLRLPNGNLDPKKITGINAIARWVMYQQKKERKK